MQIPINECTDGRLIDRLFQGDSPDWQLIDFAVLCPNCGYDLRMLPQPRCPECGTQFDWRSVMRSIVNRSTFLFEHHCRHRPFRSWFLTAWRAFAPRRFWRMVSKYDDVRAGPLWFLLLSSGLLFLLAKHGLAWLLAQSVCIASPAPGSRFDYYRMDLARLAAAPWRGEIREWLLAGCVSAAIIVFAGWVTWITRFFHRNAPPRIQVLRVVAYSAAPVCVLWAIVYMVEFSGQLLNRLVSEDVLENLYLAANWSIPAIAIYYVTIGLNRYLAVRRAILVTISASLLSMLVIGACATLLLGFR